MLQSALKPQCTLQQSLNTTLGTAQTEKGNKQPLPRLTSPSETRQSHRETSLKHQTGPQSCFQNTVSLGFLVVTSKQQAT